MANNPFLRWDVEDHSLYISYLRSAPVLASASLPVSSASTSSASVSTVSKSSSSPSGCFNCGKYGHKASDCHYSAGPPPPGPRPRPPSTSAQGQASQVPAVSNQMDNNATPPFRVPQRHSGAAGLCFAYNDGMQCPPGCQRDHRCTRCYGWHSRQDCKK